MPAWPRASPSSMLFEEAVCCLDTCFGDAAVDGLTKSFPTSFRTHLASPSYQSQPRAEREVPSAGAGCKTFRPLHPALVKAAHTPNRCQPWAESRKHLMCSFDIPPRSGNASVRKPLSKSCRIVKTPFLNPRFQMWFPERKCSCTGSRSPGMSPPIREAHRV